MPFIRLMIFSSISSLLNVLIMKRSHILVKCFFCIHWDDHVNFIHLINVIHHLHWFVYVEVSLYPRNKSCFHAVWFMIVLCAPELGLLIICGRVWHPCSLRMLAYESCVFFGFWYQGDAGLRVCSFFSP